MRQWRWLEYMEGYDWTIEYTVGKSNTVADALSWMYIAMVTGGDLTASSKETSLMALWHQWSAWEQGQIYTLVVR